MDSPFQISVIYGHFLLTLMVYGRFLAKLLHLWKLFNISDRDRLGPGKSLSFNLCLSNSSPAINPPKHANEIKVWPRHFERCPQQTQQRINVSFSLNFKISENSFWNFFFIRFYF